MNNNSSVLTKSKENTSKSFNSQIRYKLYSIEDVEKNPNRYIKISTPRSLLALKQTGISQDELYFVSFLEFIQKNPEIRKLSPEIQESRYVFFETHRKEKIKEIKSQRSKILNDELAPKNNSSRMNKSAILSLDHNQIYSTSVNNDLKQLEQMKAKNELELLNILQSEVNKELMLQEAEKKIQRQKEKFLKFQKELLQKAEEENKKKERAERERLKKQQEDEERQNKLEKEREQKEREKYKKEREDEELRQVEMKKKQVEEEKKRKMFQDKINAIVEDYKKKIEKRQKEMEKREKERQEHLEKQRQEKILEQNNIQKIKIAKINRNQQNLENKLNEIRLNLINKEKRNESKRQKFIEQRELKAQNQQELSKKKAEEIRRIQEKNELKEKQKLQEYNLRQRQISEKKKILEKQIQAEKEERNRKFLQRNDLLKKTLYKNEEILNKKKDFILKKIETKHQNLQKAILQKEKEIEMKREEQNRRAMIKDDNLLHISRREEYEREKTIEQINEKIRKAEEMKLQKSKIMEEKLRVQSEISRKKNEYSQIFQEIFSKKKLDGKTIRSLKGIFPHNSKFEALIEQLNPISSRSCNIRTIDKSFANPTNHLNRSANYYSSNKNINNISGVSQRKLSTPSSQKISSITPVENHNFDKSRDTININIININNTNNNNKTINEAKFNKDKEEKEIKINNYRLQLNQELMKVIEEEEKNEKQREKNYNKASTYDEKSLLDKKYSEERIKASNNIIQLSQSIEKKVEQYRQSLNEN